MAIISKPPSQSFDGRTKLTQSSVCIGCKMAMRMRLEYLVVESLYQQKLDTIGPSTEHLADPHKTMHWQDFRTQRRLHNFRTGFIQHRSKSGEAIGNSLDTQDAHNSNEGVQLMHHQKQAGWSIWASSTITIHGKEEVVLFFRCLK